MSEPFYGQIELFAFNYPPRDWAFCNGALLQIAQNAALFSLLADRYGGDARSTFGLPNLTSRSAVGYNMGGGGGLFTFPLGLIEGAQDQQLNVNHLTTHQHSAIFSASGGSEVNFAATTDVGDSATPTNGAYLAAPSELPGPDAPEKLFKDSPTEGSLVALGGVSGGGNEGGTVMLNTAGSNQAFSTENPYIALNFSIALQGIYPSRN